MDFVHDISKTMVSMAILLFLDLFQYERLNMDHRDVCEVIFGLQLIFLLKLHQINKKKCKSLKNWRSFFRYLWIFFCFLLTISWYSFVYSLLYNSRNNYSLELKFGQKLQLIDIFWAYYKILSHRSKFYCSRGLTFRLILSYYLVTKRGL